MTTKTPDQILDGAADILETHGWVTGECYDETLGGYCALGALTKATFPNLNNSRVTDRSYIIGETGNRYADGTKINPAHQEAAEFFARRVSGKGKSETLTDYDVYHFNDNLAVVVQYDEAVAAKLRLKSARKVVQRLRSAAKAYRKQRKAKTAA